MELYRVSLFFYHDNDYFYTNPDLKEEYFTLSTSAGEAISKVVERLISRHPHLPVNYDSCCVWVRIPQGDTPEQVFEDLKAKGSNVIE